LGRVRRRNVNMTSQSLLHHAADHVDGEGEYYGRILLRADGVEGLEVAELEGVGRFAHDVSSLLQFPRSVHLALRRDHLCSCLPGGFSFGGHRSLKLNRQSHVFNLDSFYFDTPRVRSIIQSCLHSCADVVPVGQHLLQRFGAQHVPESGLGQQPGRPVRVLHVGNGHCGVVDPVVDHRVHGYRHAVLGKDLEIIVVS